MDDGPFKPRLSPVHLGSRAGELGTWALGSQHLHCAPPLTLAPPACPAPGGNITIVGTATYHASLDPGPPYLVH